LRAVHDQGVADDKGRCARAQSDNSTRNLLGYPHSGDRFLRDDFLLSYTSASGETLHHRRVDPGHTTLIWILDCA
jgi:hypothetical protein